MASQSKTVVRSRKDRLSCSRTLSSLAIEDSSVYKFADNSGTEYTRFPMNEVKNLASSIGMDLHSDSRHSWFLHMVRIGCLPLARSFRTNCPSAGPRNSTRTEK